MIDLNPTVVIFKISEVSTQIKIGKEKLILLDVILKNIDKFHEVLYHTKNHKKVSAIIRMMCQHILNSTNR